MKLIPKKQTITVRTHFRVSYIRIFVCVVVIVSYTCHCSALVFAFCFLRSFSGLLTAVIHLQANRHSR